jgi:hypothetical protein
VAPPIGADDRLAGDGGLLAGAGIDPAEAFDRQHGGLVDAEPVAAESVLVDVSGRFGGLCRVAAADCPEDQGKKGERSGTHGGLNSEKGER